MLYSRYKKVLPVQQRLVRNYTIIKITASFGINECKDENPTKCVSKADKALYEAKNSNRNCVKIFNTQEKV